MLFDLRAPPRLAALAQSGRCCLGQGLSFV
jgi:hypothetical protein